MNTDKKTQSLAITALLTAMIFIATFAIKLPTLNGYVHPGDAMIFVAVLITGRKRGALAGGIGAALSDMLSGYAIWVLPTFICKALMAYLMGTLIEKAVFGLKGRPLWLFAAISGGIVEVIGYFAASLVLYGWAGAIAEIISNTGQAGVGIALALALSEMIQKSPLKSQLAYTTTHGARMHSDEHVSHETGREH